MKIKNIYKDYEFRELTNDEKLSFLNDYIKITKKDIRTKGYFCVFMDRWLNKRYDELFDINTKDLIILFPELAEQSDLLHLSEENKFDSSRLVWFEDMFQRLMVAETLIKHLTSK